MRVGYGLTACLLVSVISSHSEAQKLYKCGASFQDKPCDTEVQKKFSSVTGTFSREQVTEKADPQCADKGARAVPIIQAQANKESAESLHSKIDSKSISRQEKLKEKELVTLVFQKKGSASDIRGAIETECMETNQAAKKQASFYHPADTNSNQSAARARAAAAAARAEAMSSRNSR